MKALLIVVFGILSGGDTSITVMDSLEECEAALEAILAMPRSDHDQETMERYSDCVPFSVDNG